MNFPIQFMIRFLNMIIVKYFNQAVIFIIKFVGISSYSLIIIHLTIQIKKIIGYLPILIEYPNIKVFIIHLIIRWHFLKLFYPNNLFL